MLPNPRDDTAPKKKLKKHRHPTEECWRCRKEINMHLDGVEEYGKYFHINCYLHHRER